MIEHPDLLLAVCVTGLLVLRAVRDATFQPAAMACAAFIVLDVARLWTSLAAPRVDVAVFAMLPLCWVWLMSPHAAAACAAYPLVLSLDWGPIPPGPWETALGLPRVLAFALGAWTLLRPGSRQTASETVGAVMGLGCGLALAFKLWGSWGSVQVVSSVAWVTAAVTTAIPRR